MPLHTSQEGHSQKTVVSTGEDAEKLECSSTASGSTWECVGTGVGAQWEWGSAGGGGEAQGGGRGGGEGSAGRARWEHRPVHPLGDTLADSQKWSTELPGEPAILLLGFDPRQKKA